MMSTDARARVIVGVDESLAGLAALRCAVAEARRRQATLIAVRVWSLPVDWPPSPLGYQGHDDPARQAEDVVGRAFASALVAAPQDLDIRIATMRGLPGPELVRLADREDDLLVVGSRQRTLLGRMLRGSTATYCVNHADCPVLVVPRPPLAKAGTTRALSRQLHREMRKLVDAA
jgi:nucleotide-binding universal stress UspA family protein